MISLILDTGLCIHEIHNLNVSDIQNELLIIRGKGGKHRYAFLSLEVRLALKRHVKAYPKGLKKGSPLGQGRRGALTLSGLKQTVRDVGDIAGLDRTSCAGRLQPRA